MFRINSRLEVDYGGNIKALNDRPYEVASGAKLLDVNDNDYFESARDPLYLCRCAQSRNKPFCDGSYQAAGFKAEETAK